MAKFRKVGSKTGSGKFVVSEGVTCGGYASPALPPPGNEENNANSFWTHQVMVTEEQKDIKVPLPKKAHKHTLSELADE